MARKSKKDDEIMSQGFLAIIVLVAAAFYFLTKSFFIAALAAGVTIGVMVFIAFIIIDARKERLRKSGIADIDKMDGFRFEKYLGTLFAAMGYKAKVTQGSGDYGADLVLTKDQKRIVVQAKRYSKNVGIKAVQEIHGALPHYRADEAWVVTNSDFTPNAKNLANSAKVRLINREKLIDMILKVNPEHRKPS